MPQVNLTFNIPEEEWALESALSGPTYRAVVGDILEALRTKLKYAELTEVEQKVWEEIRAKVFEILRDQRVEDHFE